MARKTKKRQNIDEAEVPMSSMIDVVFLLLIYFILTQKPIIEDTFLGVDLPAPGSSKKSEKPPQLFQIDVMKLRKNSDNIYHVGGKPYRFESLKKILEQTAKHDKETTVIINCGPNARHKKLIKLLDACKEYELTKLNIVNDATVAFRPDPIVRK